MPLVWRPSVPDGATPGGLDSATLTGRMEDVPLVRDALTNAVLNLPGRNPRQTKAFFNLERVAIAAHMGLRELLLRRGGEPDTLIAIASRYL